MDPEACLDELRRLVSAAHVAQDAGAAMSDDDAFRMAELVEAMDDWLCRGGFWPRDWIRKG